MAKSSMLLAALTIRSIFSSLESLFDFSGVCQIPNSTGLATNFDCFKVSSTYFMCLLEWTVLTVLTDLYDFTDFALRLDFSLLSNDLFVYVWGDLGTDLKFLKYLDT